LWLKNALDPTERTQVQADGRVYVQAPARGYAIYVLENEYVAYTLKSAASNVVPTQDESYTVSAFPMPAREYANVNIYLTQESSVDVNIYNTSGQMVAHIYKGQLPKGSETWQWATSNIQSGLYLCKVNVNGKIRVLKILVT
jgi:alpha-amylase